MCIVFIAYRYHPGYPLIIAANRDEFYDRPTDPLDFWADHPDVAAGIDRQAGGTWLGMTRRGRFAAITNYRDPRFVDPAAPSRGCLVRAYLVSDQSPAVYLADLAEQADKYNGFNLIAGDIAGDSPGIFYYSNMEGRVRPIPPGLHGLSNHLLNTPWPKVERARRGLEKVLAPTGEPDSEAIFEVLGDITCPPDEDIPDTGIGLAWERMLAPVFIQSDVYGTRNSTLIFVDNAGHVTFSERRFEPDGKGALAVNNRRLSFKLVIDGKYQ
ncbi:MAG: NRDE family protein [Thermodesulfobacteriota bacterium]|nr:NRDE family protein [Thermodesulfobacteriota bacterium]